LRELKLKNKTKILVIDNFTIKPVTQQLFVDIMNDSTYDDIKFVFITKMLFNVIKSIQCMCSVLKLYGGKCYPNKIFNVNDIDIHESNVNEMMKSIKMAGYDNYGDMRSMLNYTKFITTSVNHVDDISKENILKKYLQKPNDDDIIFFDTIFFIKIL
jgi:hypothetical protein